MLQMTAIDALAIGWFFLCWIGLTIWVDSPDNERSRVTKTMRGYRRLWMENLVTRELRMIDTMIQSSLLNGVAFFASTSLLAVGGLVTVLGATDTAIELLQDFPVAVPTTRTVWELKVLLMIGILTYAFFKFTWCYRLFIHCVILMGAAPPPDVYNDYSRQYADRLAGIHELGAKHFNRGLRAYMFALAAMTWFLHPGFFIATTAWVTLVLYRREFASRSLDFLGPEPEQRRPLDDSQNTDPDSPAS